MLQIIKCLQMLSHKNIKMKRFFSTIFLIAIYSSNLIAQEKQEFNFGFEKQSNKKVLSDGWKTYLKGEKSLGSIDSIIKYQGRKSGKITNSNNYQIEEALFIEIPANYGASKTLELEGYIKTKNINDGFVGLMLGTSGENGNWIEASLMENNPIKGTTDWTKYSIKIGYSENAKKISLGGYFKAGTGVAWYDSFVLKVDGVQVEFAEGKGAISYKAEEDKEFENGSNLKINSLTKSKVRDLELVGKVWGFLKYFHPEIAKGNYNWDYELFRFLKKFNQTKKSKRALLLIEWIDSLGKIHECLTCKDAKPDSPVKPDFRWIEKIKNQDLKKKLFFIYKNRSQDNHYYVDISSPAIYNPKHESLYKNMPYPDEGFRLLSLYRFWNIIQYFYPYQHIFDKDWNTILSEYIPKFLDAKDELSYELVVNDLMVDLNDSHADVLGANKLTSIKYKKNLLPIKVSRIENKFIITDFYNEDFEKNTDLKIGDEIIKFEGKYLKEIVEEYSKLISSSRKSTLVDLISLFQLLSSNEEKALVEYKTNDHQIKKEKVKLYSLLNSGFTEWRSKKLFGKGVKSYKFVRKDIGYINFAAYKLKDLKNIKNDFKNCKGIIVDIRNYNKDESISELTSFFMSKPKETIRWFETDYKSLGEYRYVKPYILKSAKEYFKGKVIVLVNNNTVSKTEENTMTIQVADDAVVIGSNTQGSLANISRFPLPGNLKIRYTAVANYYPNKTHIQRVGITPDIEVKPTIKGIKEGRDELLEKAIQLINK